MAVDNIFLTAGSTVGISSTLPATRDQAGYEALTYTNIEGVVNIGNFGGSANVPTIVPLSTGDVEKRVGSRDYGSPVLQLVYVPDDAGQAALKAAFDGANERLPQAFKVEYPNGDVRYFVGPVSSFENQPGDSDSFLQVAATVAISGKVLEVNT